LEYTSRIIPVPSTKSIVSYSICHVVAAVEFHDNTADVGPRADVLKEVGTVH
jgi:hypothetical protein